LNYIEKLRDPRWQRRRLECFQSAGWKCERCHSGTKPLNAHHRQYRPGREPWEYELGELVCLCEDCHAERHGLRETDGLLKQVIAQMEHAHACRDWDAMYKAAEIGASLIACGFYYKGLT
jgi:hypothetical protein